MSHWNRKPSGVESRSIRTSMGASMRNSIIASIKRSTVAHQSKQPSQEDFQNNKCSNFDTKMSNAENKNKRTILRQNSVGFRFDQQDQSAAQSHKPCNFGILNAGRLSNVKRKSNSEPQKTDFLTLYDADKTSIWE